MDFKKYMHFIISLSLGFLLILVVILVNFITTGYSKTALNNENNPLSSNKTIPTIMSIETIPVNIITTIEEDSTTVLEESSKVVDGSFSTNSKGFIKMDAVTARNYMYDGNYEGEKIVFLTFDDGPSYNATPAILDILKENDVPATFFYYTLGNLSDKEDVIRRTIDEGHSIGLHTNSHDYSEIYPKDGADPDAIIEDLTECIAKIREVVPEFDTSLYRFPGGSFGGWTNMKTAKEAVSYWGVEYIDWNTSTGDALPNNDDFSPQGLLEYLHNQTEIIDNKDLLVVLMHDADWQDHSVPALQGVIDYYKERGYSFGVLE